MANEDAGREPQALPPPVYPALAALVAACDAGALETALLDAFQRRQTGSTTRRVCRELCLPPWTLAEWERHPLWRAARQELLQERYDRLTDLMGTYGATLGELMEEGKPEERILAAREWRSGVVALRSLLQDAEEGQRRGFLAAIIASAPANPDAPMLVEQVEVHSLFSTPAQVRRLPWTEPEPEGVEDS